MGLKPPLTARLRKDAGLGEQGQRGHDENERSIVVLE